MERGAEPLFRSADNGFLRGLINRRGGPEKPSGVRLDLDGSGASSGFGPELIFYNHNFLGRGINVEIPLLFTYNFYELFRFSAAVPILNHSSARSLTFDLGTAYSSRARELYTVIR